VYNGVMRYTIRDLQGDFPDDKACLKWLVEYLYPEGIHCIKCAKVTPHHAMNTRKSYSCEMCGHHVHPTAGTIFEKSSTPLTLWFYAIYLMSATRSGISAKQLERELGVTYKTAWRMFHQIRKMMRDDTPPLTGDVEIDETYWGKRPDRRTSLKPQVSQAVFGAVERGGRAKVVHVPKVGKALIPVVEEHVDKSAWIYSDDYMAYRSLYWKGYNHQTVKHSEKQWVNGKVHTQNIENLWGGFKRGMKGVYIHCEPKYLQAYIDEYAFRYSHRETPSMFWALLGRVAK